jgi:hypothetical protein
LLIPNVIPNPVSCPLRSASRPGRVVLSLALVFVCGISAYAADWSASEQQLAKKIFAVAGNDAVSFSVENRSSLGRRDSEIIQNGLRSALMSAGVRFAPAGPSPISVTITLSENVDSYIWVAEIHKSEGETQVTMVSMPRPSSSLKTADTVPLSLRKTPLWNQAARILDVAVLEEGATPIRLAVLDAEGVSLYRLQNGRWELEQTLPITHDRPWPRDLRGKVVAARDHLLDVFLPGVVCHTTGSQPMIMNCHDGEDPWPLIVPGQSEKAASDRSAISSAFTMPTLAFFSPARNFFTGAFSPPGLRPTVSQFYSSAFLQRDNSLVGLFAAVDGQVHFFDGVRERVTRLDWGSDITSVRTSCGAGWQVLATGAGDAATDSVRAYEIPDQDPVPVSAAIDFSGPISALWTESRGDTAIAVARNTDTGEYEAFRLAVVCSQ